MTKALDVLERVEDGQLKRLHERLEADAAGYGLLDAAYRTVNSPLGDLLIVATEKGIVRVAFSVEDHSVVLESLAARLGPRILKLSSSLGIGGRLDEAEKELGEYFEGHRTGFDVPVDLTLAKGFRRVVLEHLQLISYGSTESYSEVAAASGSPRAVRAVGSACATNPLPVIVPCHRVLRSDGSLGGYLGGLDAKRALLALEAVA